ncbi:MAG: histone deacetylase [Nitrospirae bacterium]|nr:histone deacetylase [Nitrospirota bacterium]
MKVGFVYDDVYLMHRPLGFHPERPERLRAIVDVLKANSIWNELIQIKPIKAEDSLITSVHDVSYLDRVKTATPGYFDPDTYFSEGSLEAALSAAGAVVEAIRMCKEGEIQRAFCAVRPPGHHAESDRAMGFCIFNNIAIGARYAQSLGYEKVFIIDFDVHHGNGTEHMFYEDDSVFYFSTHQYPHYPGTGSTEERGRGKGEGFTYNIPMPAGAGDSEYIDAYTIKLPELVKQFDPDMVLVSAGYDLHEKDPLAGIAVTDAGIRAIVRGILDSKEAIPFVFALEGGYNLEALARSVFTTVEELLKD